MSAEVIFLKKNISSREVISILKEHGFVEDKRRRTGGDTIFVKQG